MNARFVKLTIALCSLCLFHLAVSVRAQDANPDEVSPPPGYTTNGGVPQPPGYGQSNLQALRRQREEAAMVPQPVFDIQIENGELSLAPLAGHSELTNFWGRSPGRKTVPANMENLSRYLRATDTNLSVILSPGIGNFTISNLKIKTSFLRSIQDAINVASGNTIEGNAGFGGGRQGFGGFGSANRENSITFASSRSATRSSVEVFNLSGYIQTLGKVGDDVVTRKIDELQDLVQETLQRVPGVNASTDFPNFKYHPGTKLLIVIGKPEDIEVTRKIINALSGQQTNGKTDLLLDMAPASDQK